MEQGQWTGVLEKELDNFAKVLEKIYINKFTKFESLFNYTCTPTTIHFNSLNPYSPSTIRSEFKNVENVDKMGIINEHTVFT